MRNIPKPVKTLAAGAMLLVLGASTFAQSLPFSKAGTGQPALPPPSEAVPANTAASATNQNAIEKFFDGKIPEALANGKFDLDVRARVEDANESGIPSVKKASVAPTIRTRLGYTTASLYGFQAGVQGQNTSAIGSDGNYNAAGSNGKGYKPVIADPPMTDLDQAWLKYAYTNMFDVSGGRQRLNLDNQRFVGNVDWRQNIQTFDSATAHVQPIDHLDLTYDYIWDAYRVYGNVSGLPAANTDYDSDSHLVNVDYSGWKYGRFVCYAYLLDLNNDAGANNSCATYGGYLAGNAPLMDKLSVDYRGEYAWQENYGDSKLRYNANYANLEAGANYQPFAAGAGWEDLGSGLNTGAGGGRAAFRTPLDTAHSFNGWAEMFLSAPAEGLHDLYGYVQVTLPAEIPLRFVYHKFDSDSGSGDYGQEFDLVVTRKFGKHWQALLEYAYYDGANAAPPAITVAHVNMERIWAQFEFMF
ncbi:MAG TPA: alginate export family protein [Verrucomicrobiae bacterium]|jgi:hypothetical protein|nr:alginate export family protein [Verrucomicrobiae bacterium]